MYYARAIGFKGVYLSPICENDGSNAQCETYDGTRRRYYGYRCYSLIGLDGGGLDGTAVRESEYTAGVSDDGIRVSSCVQFVEFVKLGGKVVEVESVELNEKAPCRFARYRARIWRF